MDAVQKIFKLEKEIQEIRPMIQEISKSSNTIVDSVSQPDLVSSITSRIANMEWRAESKKSGQIPYQVEKAKPFSLTSMLRNNK